MIKTTKFYDIMFEDGGGGYTCDWYKEFCRVNDELNKLKEETKDSIPRSVAFSIANRFYGSDYNLQWSQFNNAAKDLGY